MVASLPPPTTSIIKGRICELILTRFRRITRRISPGGKNHQNTCSSRLPLQFATRLDGLSDTASLEKSLVIPHLGSQVSVFSGFPFANKRRRVSSSCLKFICKISVLKKPFAFQCLLAPREIDLWRPPHIQHITEETTLTVAFVASASWDLGHISIISEERGRSSTWKGLDLILG